MTISTSQQRDWESIFKTWSSPPSKTEEERCKNAESVIRSAIASSQKLNDRGVKVFMQGSYRNNTNVRQDSDVDICVLCESVAFSDLPDGVSLEDVGRVPSSYTHKQFKYDVLDALYEYLGRNAVTPGEKALDVHANSYRVDADVVPAFEYRKYSSATDWDTGIAISPANGRRIINWPEQHYQNGVAKNFATSRRYKGVVRIMKKLKSEMVECGATADTVPSFLLECMLWNVDNSHYGHASLYEDVEQAILYMYQRLESEELCDGWTEVNGIKPLFSKDQKWTREDARAFLIDAWNYVGFK